METFNKLIREHLESYVNDLNKSVSINEKYKFLTNTVEEKTKYDPIFPDNYIYEHIANVKKDEKFLFRKSICEYLLLSKYYFCNNPQLIKNIFMNVKDERAYDYIFYFYNSIFDHATKDIIIKSLVLSGNRINSLFKVACLPFHSNTQIHINDILNDNVAYNIYKRERIYKENILNRNTIEKIFSKIVSVLEEKYKLNVKKVRSIDISKNIEECFVKIVGEDYNCPSSLDLCYEIYIQIISNIEFNYNDVSGLLSDTNYITEIKKYIDYGDVINNSMLIIANDIPIPIKNEDIEPTGSMKKTKKKKKKKRTVKPFDYWSKKISLHLAHYKQSKFVCKPWIPSEKNKVTKEIELFYNENVNDRYSPRVLKKVFGTYDDNYIGAYFDLCLQDDNKKTEDIRKYVNGVLMKIIKDIFLNIEEKTCKKMTEYINDDVICEEYKKEVRRILELVIGINNSYKGTYMLGGLMMFGYIHYLIELYDIDSMKIKKKLFDGDYDENIGSDKDNKLYDLLSKDIIISQGKFDNIPDCGETTLRNVINIILLDKKDKFVIDLIKDENVKSFYEKYDTIDKQKTQEARNEWAINVLNKIIIDNNFVHMKNRNSFPFDYKPTSENSEKILECIFDAKNENLYKIVHRHNKRITPYKKNVITADFPIVDANGKTHKFDFSEIHAGYNNEEYGNNENIIKKYTGVNKEIIEKLVVCNDKLTEEDMHNILNNAKKSNGVTIIKNIHLMAAVFFSKYYDIMRDYLSYFLKLALNNNDVKDVLERDFLSITNGSQIIHKFAELKDTFYIKSLFSLVKPDNHIFLTSALDWWNNTPLAISVQKCALETTKFLIEKNSDVNITDSGNRNLVEIAYDINDPAKYDIIIELIKKNKELILKKGLTEGSTLYYMYMYPRGSHEKIEEITILILDKTLIQNHGSTLLQMFTSKLYYKVLKYIASNPDILNIFLNTGVLFNMILDPNTNYGIPKQDTCVTLINEKTIDMILNNDNMLLLKCLQHKYYEIIMALVKYKHNIVNERIIHKNKEIYPLCYSYEKNSGISENSITVLIKNGADTTIMCNNKPILLHAIANCHCSVVSLMLEKDINILTKASEKYGNLLCYLYDLHSDSNNTLNQKMNEMQSFLIKNGVKLEGTLEERTMMLLGNVKIGNLENIKILINNDKNLIRAVSTQNEHLLSFFSRHCCEDENLKEKIGLFLIENDVDINCFTEDSRFVCNYNFYYDSEYNQNAHNELKSIHVIFSIIHFGHVNVAKEMIKKDKNIMNVKNVQGMTPLHYSFCNLIREWAVITKPKPVSKNKKPNDNMFIKCANFVNIFLDAGCNTSIKDIDGNTPLHYMIMANLCDDDIYKKLLKNNIETTNDMGETPLILACRVINKLLFGNPKIIFDLVASGANVNATDKNDKTMINYLSAYHSESIKNKLMEKSKEFSKTYEKKYIKYKNKYNTLKSHIMSSKYY